MSLHFEQGDKIYTVAYIRYVRNGLLQECDWTQASDSPLSDSKKTEWATYRQKLRDLPSKYKDDDSVSDVVWPTMPT